MEILTGLSIRPEAQTFLVLTQYFRNLGLEPMTAIQTSIRGISHELPPLPFPLDTESYAAQWILHPVPWLATPVGGKLARLSLLQQ